METLKGFIRSTMKQVHILVLWSKQSQAGMKMTDEVQGSVEIKIVLIITNHQYPTHLE